MQAAIYGLEGLELTDQERAFLRRRRACGVHPFPPQLRDARPVAAADRFAARADRPVRPADPDRPGRRPGGADAAAGMAGFPDRRAVRPALRPRAVLGDRGGAVERARDRADASRVRDQRQRAAAARRSPGRRDRHHRRPRAGLGADAGRGARPRGARRDGLGRSGRDRQAHAGPRPGAGRQPQGIAGRPGEPPRRSRPTSSRSSGCRGRRWG